MEVWGHAENVSSMTVQSTILNEQNVEMFIACSLSRFSTFVKVFFPDTTCRLVPDAVVVVVEAAMSA